MIEHFWRRQSWRGRCLIAAVLLLFASVPVAAWTIAMEFRRCHYRGGEMFRSVGCVKNGMIVDWKKK